MRAASLKSAEAAREQFSDELAKRGAHAIGVEKAGQGWAVVAYVEPTRAFDAPVTLATTLQGQKVEVPLVVQREDTFKAE